MVNTANAEGRVYRAERSHGKKNRNHGVNVAENCNRLRAQRLHAAKVQGVSKARVEHAENQQAGKRHWLEGFRREALARKRAVGHHGTWLYGIIFRCSHSIGR